MFNLRLKKTDDNQITLKDFASSNNKVMSGNFLEILQARVDKLGYNYNVNEIDHDLLNELQLLHEQSVTIPDNLLNPEIDIAILVLYLNMITQSLPEDEDRVTLAVLDYINPNMGFSHFKYIREAIENQESHLLEQFKQVAENNQLSKSQKETMFCLIKFGKDYQYIATSNFTNEELRQIEIDTKKLNFTHL